MRDNRIVAIAMRYSLYMIGAAIAFCLLRAAQEQDVLGVLHPLKEGVFRGWFGIFLYYGVVVAAVVFAFEVYPSARGRRDDRE